jgi:hypothetical protein
MTRNENQMYSNISSIAKSLEKIANALETNVPTTPKPKDIPGFEGTLDALDVLCDIKTITDEYATLNQSNEALIARHKTKLSSEFQKQDTLTPTSDNPDPAGYGGGGFDGLVEYETDLQEIRVDSDHDIRSTAAHYEETVLANGGTKKECILDYVTNEFGALGARYTDIIKFAYYLGAHNAPKYTNASRGYYSCAFNVRLNGHLIQGGKDQLVKGINKEGDERYFALSMVDNFTDYYKRIA